MADSTGFMADSTDFMAESTDFESGTIDSDSDESSLNIINYKSKSVVYF